MTHVGEKCALGLIGLLGELLGIPQALLGFNQGLSSFLSGLSAFRDALFEAVIQRPKFLLGPVDFTDHGIEFIDQLPDFIRRFLRYLHRVITAGGNLFHREP